MPTVAHRQHTSGRPAAGGIDRKTTKNPEGFDQLSQTIAGDGLGFPICRRRCGNRLGTPVANLGIQREEWIREPFTEVQAMLYLTTLVLLLVVVDSIHAIGSHAS